MKNLYLLRRNDIEKDAVMYDKYDSMVVCAFSMVEAKRISIQRHFKMTVWKHNEQQAVSAWNKAVLDYKKEKEGNKNGHCKNA